MQTHIRQFTLYLLVGVLTVSAGCNAITGTGNESPSTGMTIVNQDATDYIVLVEITDGPNAEIPDGPKVFYSAGRTMENDSKAELEPFNRTGDYDVTIVVNETSIDKTYSFGLNDNMTIGIQNSVPYIAANSSPSYTENE